MRDSFSLHLNDSMTIEKKKSLSNHSPLLLSLRISVLPEGAIKSEERLSHLKNKEKRLRLSIFVEAKNYEPGI